jgi:hypothetical protein
VSATAAARKPGIAPNSRKQKRPNAPQPSKPTPSFSPGVSVSVDVFMALEHFGKELRRHSRGCVHISEGHLHWQDHDGLIVLSLICRTILAPLIASTAIRALHHLSVAYPTETP